MEPCFVPMVGLRIFYSVRTVATTTHCTLKHPNPFVSIHLSDPQCIAESPPFRLTGASWVLVSLQKRHPPRIPASFHQTWTSKALIKRAACRLHTVGLINHARLAPKGMHRAVHRIFIIVLFAQLFFAMSCWMRGDGVCVCIFLELLSGAHADETHTELENEREQEREKQKHTNEKYERTNTVQQQFIPISHYQIGTMRFFALGFAFSFCSDWTFH
uniref:Uncharacterized protein n=1 Tax=Anopheles dirus TaxID=7168 RepID=A0A182NYD6_9DIPT